MFSTKPPSASLLHYGVNTPMQETRSSGSGCSLLSGCAWMKMAGLFDNIFTSAPSRKPSNRPSGNPNFINQRAAIPSATVLLPNCYGAAAICARCKRYLGTQISVPLRFIHTCWGKGLPVWSALWVDPAQLDYFQTRQPPNTLQAPIIAPANTATAEPHPNR